jgi:hypothetical protein
LTDDIAFRIASETILNNSNGKTPFEIFHGISDDFGFG